MRKIAVSKLNDLFAAIAKDEALYLPALGGDGRANYTKWAEGVEYSNALNTVRSAKDFFFPQTENLMDFKMEGKTIEVIDTREECEDFVVFGVRACDVRSFDILDRVFLVDPVDTYYKNRREHGVIMSMACGKPSETCFCGTFGIDASAPKGDVECYTVGNELYMNAITEKGAALMNKLADITEECGDEAVNAEKAVIKERLNKLPLANLKSDAFGGGKTDAFFKAPEWKELSETCLGCGTCTFVCPTCQCYDIRDFKTNKGVQRFRCWDSCMYSDFTKMAHGNNRISQLERFRQRFMHKLVYYPENNEGIFGCVGCGRCISRCPISMNIVKVMKKLGGNA